MTVPIEKTLEHAMFLARHARHYDHATLVSLVLYELGFAPKKDGFHYLKKVVVLCYKNPCRLLENDIYMELSAGISDNKRIEQAIRRSIADAWKVRDEEIWTTVFPVTRVGKRRRPSNGDFIANLAWFVELWDGCCKEVTYANE